MRSDASNLKAILMILIRVTDFETEALPTFLPLHPHKLIYVKLDRRLADVGARLLTFVVIHEEPTASQFRSHSKLLGCFNLLKHVEEGAK
jgi:hypothetical protein